MLFFYLSAKFSSVRMCFEGEVLRVKLANLELSIASAAMRFGIMFSTLEKKSF